MTNLNYYYFIYPVPSMRYKCILTSDYALYFELDSEGPGYNY